MRTTALIILFLLFSSGKSLWSDGSVNTSCLLIDKKIVFNFPAINAQNTQKKLAVVDTADLKKGSWYSNAIKNIEESEYKIKYDESTHSYASPNRKQNLRAFYTGDQFTLLPRNDSVDKWKLILQLKGIYSNTNKIYAAANDPLVTQNGNSIQFNHNNEFITEYINSEEGVRQNFIITRQPAGNPKNLRVRLKTNKDWFINKVTDKEIHFAKAIKNGYDKKITYNGLKAWDANGKELEAAFAVNKNKVSIDVITNNAVYPITIDPLSTGTAGTPDWIGHDANQALATFGQSVASAGDVNGDGYSDVIIGASGYTDGANTSEGRVFVYHGSTTGLSATPNSTFDDANQAYAHFGLSVAGAGDINGDGYSDVIIGAYLYDDGANMDEGRAFVYHGSAAGLSASPNSILDDADQADASFGWSVASAGDVNGDGYSDVIIGARSYNDAGNTNEGRAFVYHGSVTGLSAAPNSTPGDANQPEALFGNSVASAGDVNGDGYSDVIIGAYLYDDGANLDEGRAFVYHGSATGLSATPSSTPDDADQVLAYFGYSVASAGDVNGDGYSDVIMGSFYYNDGASMYEGRAFVYHGSATGISASPNSTPDDANQSEARFGVSVACAGDINGDGYSDVIIGAYLYNQGANMDEGRAFVYYGSSGGLNATPYSTPDDADRGNAEFGASVASAGDVNGDGYSDVIIGAHYYTEGANTQEGRTFVYHGGPDGLSTSPVNTPGDANQANANFGVSVASAGDVNGDGFSDVIIGAWRYTDGANANEGWAFVYHGSATGLSATPNNILDDADQANAFFAEAVACAGDVNGDGYSDVIIGADNYNDAGNNAEGRAFVYHGSSTGLSASPNSILDDADQAFAFFGVSVASAGDVNADGYSDVIVGAIGMTDGGNANEGRAYIYHGSSTGLGLTPNSTLDDADQANAWFGWSVAGAGDVNGDGYCDVIIGALTYDEAPNTDEGRAFVYHGGPTGVSISPDSTPDDANQAFAQFGESVATAGDVNGDGFSDVIIGAKLYDDGFADEGRAFVYHGGPSGLSADPISTPDDANQSGAHFGISVSSAGDVNGDGYSDVIIGARYYDDGANSNEGRAFVYYGSSTGLSTSPNSTPDDADQADSEFGYTVACAGDINGDGYSDVIVGAFLYDGGASNEGRAFVYYGNNTGGFRNNLRLYNQDLVTPIQQSSMASALFGAGLYAKSPLGRQKGKLVWETVKNGQPFSGNPITNSTSFLSQQPSLTDLGLNGLELKNQIAKEFNSRVTYVRTRVKYDLVTAITGQVYGPWHYPESFLRGNRYMGAVVLPVKFASFTAVKQNDDVLLKWITTDETPGIRYEIMHSKDGINFTKIGNLTGFNNTHNEYEWLHTNPSDGKNFYRIRAVENGKEVLTSIRQVYFGKNYLVSLYPNPAKSGSTLTIELLNTPQTSPSLIEIFSINGQKHGSWPIAQGNNRITLTLANLSAGIYSLKMINANKELYSASFVVIK